MTIRKLYPEGLKKAFNVNYDDGVLQDVRFVELLNRYGIKGTFNLNSQLTENRFIWKHESGMTVERLSRQQAVDLYRGLEVASHSLTHPNLCGLDEKSILYEMLRDRKNLENWFGYKIKGFAYPFAAFNDLTTRCARKAGFTYARIGDETRNFGFPEDPFLFSGSYYHTDDGLEDFIKRFIDTEEELAFCQLVGHTYELDLADRWENMENIFKNLSLQKNVWFAGTIEIVEYREAMKLSEISAGRIINHSSHDLWFELNGKTVMVKGLSHIQIN